MLLTIAELKEGRAPKSLWSKASDLITHILASEEENAPSAPSNNVKDPNSLQQELINIVVRSLGLKPLEGEAKENCQKGHEMEPIFSQQLLAAAGCPWGQIEEIDKVGLVQKAGMKHMKASVDRIACMSNNSGDKELLLVEFKARVKPETARAEEERIDALWSNGLMDEESIFCEITSDEPDSFDFIPSEQERYQAIHHAAVYEKNLILHVVGDSKEILSCTKMTFTPDLLEAHQRTTDLIYDLALKPLIEAPNPKRNFSGAKEFMDMLKHAVNVNKDTLT